MEMLERNGARLVIHLPAELDHHHTEEIRKKIDQLVREEPISELEFNFAETVFMDSAGIGLILGRYQLMRAVGGRILVSRVNGQIGRLLSLSGIQKYIRLEKEEGI